MVEKEARTRTMTLITSSNCPLDLQKGFSSKGWHGWLCRCYLYMVSSLCKRQGGLCTQQPAFFVAVNTTCSHMASIFSSLPRLALTFRKTLAMTGNGGRSLRSGRSKVGHQASSGGGFGTIAVNMTQRVPRAKWVLNGYQLLSS